MHARGSTPLPELPDFKTGFASVDGAETAAPFIRLLDTASSAEWFRTIKRRTFDLLEPREGKRLLDVGCGTGDDARALARRVGTGGRVVGVDRSEALVAEARRRTEGEGAPVEFRVGDAHRLDLPDGSFDGSRADRVLQHLDDPRAALGEMVRVTRSGGRVVVFDSDWETLILDADDRRVTRIVLNALCGSIRDGWIGRRLAPLFRELGLVDISVVPDTLLLPRFVVVDRVLGVRRTVERVREAGLISAEEGRRWLAEQEERDRTGRFFCSVTSFTVSGRTP